AAKRAHLSAALTLFGASRQQSYRDALRIFESNRYSRSQPRSCRIANDGNRENPYFTGSFSPSCGTGNIGASHDINRILSVGVFRKSPRTIVGDSEMRICRRLDLHRADSPARKSLQQALPNSGRILGHATHRRPRRPGFLFKDLLEKSRADSGGIRSHLNGSRLRQPRICRLRLAPASGISALTELWPS